MPLVVITGHPCTGKTCFSQILLEYLSQMGIKSIEIINDESLHITKKLVYSSITTTTEKQVRSNFKSAVDHAIRSDHVIIMDSLNYIKGFRYELYCTSRTYRTLHCVVWVDCPESIADEIHRKRVSEGKDSYDDNILKDLRMRYEEPNPSNRWDSPLFKVNIFPNSKIKDSDKMDNSVEIDPLLIVPTPKPLMKSSWKPNGHRPTTSIKEVTKDEQPHELSNTLGLPPMPSKTTTDVSMLPVSPTANNAVSFSGNFKDIQHHQDSLSSTEACEKIYNFLTNAAVPNPNPSTLSHTHSTADLLYELDRISQKILNAIIKHQSETVEGTPLKFVDYDRELTLHRHASLAELQRHRKQFVKINGQHPPSTSQLIGTCFIDFLALHL